VILCVVWSRSRLAQADLEVLDGAGRLAEMLGLDVVLAALDAAAAADAGRFGVKQAFALQSVDTGVGNDAAIAAIAALARDLEAAGVVLAADGRSREVAPRLAERLSGTAVTSVVALEAREGRPAFVRSVYGGKALAAVRATRTPVVVSLQPGSFDPAPERPAPATVQILPVPSVDDGGWKLVEQVDSVSGGAELDQARVIVSGGRGIGDAAGFRVLEQLAEVLNGSVGASLAAVDEGWAPPEQQVGLTGRTVRPDIYFAVGISGASQHLAGVRAKSIVAINSNPDAAIFEAADLGIVGDWRALVPALIAECRRRLSS
jgi:electron transfer flavoprotein alpha subunit